MLWAALVSSPRTWHFRHHLMLSYILKYFILTPDHSIDCSALLATWCLRMLRKACCSSQQSVWSQHSRHLSSTAFLFLKMALNWRKHILSSSLYANRRFPGFIFWVFFSTSNTIYNLLSFRSFSSDFFSPLLWQKKSFCFFRVWKSV